MKKHKLAVVIGRFQPFHIGHEAMVEYALSLAEKVVVVLGGFADGQSDRNPYGAYQRSEMIYRTMRSNHIRCMPVENQSADNVWKDKVESSVKKMYNVAFPSNSDYDIVLVGYEKDDSSYYLSLSKDWKFYEAPAIATEKGNVLSATHIREGMLKWNSTTSGGELVSNLLPDGTKGALTDLCKYGAIPFTITEGPQGEKYEHISATDNVI